MSHNFSENLLLGLNDRQKEAVQATEGALLILAGAGSGKTKVVTHRIANLIGQGVAPGSILAITFTNKAAGEMQKRVGKLLGHDEHETLNHFSGLPAGACGPARLGRTPFLSTFHSLGVYLLREAGSAIGLPRSFSILDSEDALAIVKGCLKTLALDPKQYQPSKMLALISRYKNEFLTPADLFEEGEESPFIRTILNIWEVYDAALKEHKAVDFDDLIVLPVRLFEKHPAILEQFQERWHYIHIDEYQDTNRPQYLLVKLLAAKYRNVCAVGDIDQSIYGWRGADFKNIMDFEKDYPETKVVTLEQNYRSTQNILEAANAVIVKNRLRKPKNLFTEAELGGRIKLFSASNELEEARFIAENAARAIRSGVAPEKIAVLYRTNFQSRVIEEAFLGRNLPYQLIGVKFYERKEVKDILAYIRAALNGDDLLSIKRAINTPPRGIGKVLLTKFLAKDALSGKEAAKVGEFQNILAKVASTARAKIASEAMRETLALSGYQDFLNDGTEEGEMRLGNLKELVTLAKRYDAAPAPQGLEALLTDAALMADQDTLKEDKKAVRLMTVHAAKGLEFHTVFVAGMEDGLFPHASLGGNEDDEVRGEEERRLFYVAVTRAERELYLSHAFFRTIFGMKQVSRPSRFIADLPPHLVDSLDPDNAVPEERDLVTDEHPNEEFPIINL
ncbi:MAG: UvrD-helicase domain-containing protein [Candidatus Niyogibacteria bacterium]|nr:UvrD-helicase domain-containing protein [Candidatus Niyogibacteria bacterium]